MRLTLGAASRNGRLGRGGGKVLHPKNVGFLKDRLPNGVRGYVKRRNMGVAAAVRSIRQDAKTSKGGRRHSKPPSTKNKD